jgi:hypothetical protein
MSTAAYFVPSLASRAKAAASLAAILFWGTTHHLWFSPLIEQIDSCELCSSLWATRLVAVYLSLLPLALGLWLAHTADEILRSGQNPPPKSWLLFKVRLHTGLRAKLGAYALAAAAFCAAVAPGVLAYNFGVAYLFCVAEECDCKATPTPSEQACASGVKRNEA